jgi:hypothetical protein
MVFSKISISLSFSALSSPSFSISLFESSIAFSLSIICSCRFLAAPSFFRVLIPVVHL